MSPNSTSKTNFSFLNSYFWTALLALFMAIVLSQWAVADPPDPNDQSETIEEVEQPTDIVDESTPSEPIANETKIMSPIFDGTESAEKCFEQKDGSYECVCEGEEDCETLKTAEYCEPESHWGKDGYGGCTKKAPEE